jgi:hypothetical protein
MFVKGILDMNVGRGGQLSQKRESKSTGTAQKLREKALNKSRNPGRYSLLETHSCINLNMISLVLLDLNRTLYLTKQAKIVPALPEELNLSFKLH